MLVRFFKRCPVPFAIKDAIGHELDELEQQGIIQKVTHSDWAALIVVVPKKDGKFCICGDYKVTVNQVLSVDQYQLPKPEDLFATLSEGKVLPSLTYHKLIFSFSWMKYRLTTSLSTLIKAYTCTVTQDSHLVWHQLQLCFRS